MIITHLLRKCNPALINIAILAMSVFAHVDLRAQTSITGNSWTGQGTSGAGPSAFTALPATGVPGAAVVAISQWNRAASLTNTSAGGCYNSSNWQLGGSLAIAQANNKYIYFTVTNDAATELQVTNILILSQVSSTGPSNVQMQYAIGSGADNNYGAPIATAHTASPENLSFTQTLCIAPGQTVRFKLYAWGGSNTAGTVRVNNGTSITAFFAPGITSSASNSSPVCAGNPLSFTGTFSGGIPGYTYSWAGPSGFSSALQNPVIAAPAAGATGIYTFTVTDALSCTAAVAAVTTATVTAAPAAITGSSVVCVGTTIVLSDPDPGGSWSSGNAGIADVGTSTGIVSGISPGTAIITYSIGTSCIATKIVTVNPAAAAITGSASVCVGLTTLLTDVTAGGVWSSSATAIATVTAAGLVSGIAPGTAVISYTLPAACFSIMIVTVNAFPTAITGPATVCVGAAATLSNASPSGTWSSGDILIATVNAGTGVVTGLSPGTANITYTLPGGCNVVYIITVNPLPNAITGNSVVCVNATITLANTTGGGAWSSSDISVAGVNTFGTVLGNSAGTAIISYTLPTACYTTATVTVNPIPLPITGPSGVCLGATVTISNAMPGGIWSSSNANATIGALSGVVSGNIVGTSMITYQLTATGCFITRTQTVHPLPGSITGPGTVCPGTIITLSDLPAGGTWTSNPLTIASANLTTGEITGITAGTALITYTLATGCTATTVITVNPAPISVITPIGDTMMCPGDFVTLTANTGTGLTYQWLVGGVLIPGISLSTYVAGTTGAYQAQVTNILGCATLSVPMSVSVNAVIAAIAVAGGSPSGCAATGVLLDAGAGSGLSYQWLLSGIPIPGANANTYTATTTGDYTVFVSNTTGCSATSLPQTITISPSPASGVTVSGLLTFCQGNTAVISAAAGTGYTYQWYSFAGAISGATGSSYTATATGSYYVNITNVFGCITTSAVTGITVNASPVVAIAAAGPKVVCAGGNVPLSVIAAAGYVYQWYRSGIAIPGATGSSYVATQAGGYRVRITNTLTGCTDMTHADTVITVVASPLIIPLTPAAFCWGGSSVLSTSASSAGLAIAYQWYRGSVLIPGATGSTYTATGTGDYSCTLTVAGSCMLTTAAIPVNERPLPDPIITFTGTALKTAPYYQSYQWYKDLVAIPGATGNATIPTGNGSYKVFVADTNSCQAASTSYVLTQWGGPTAAGSVIAPDNVLIYPNPASNVLTVVYAGDVSIIISSMDGKVVLSQGHAGRFGIDNIPKGIYIIRVFDEQGTLLKIEKLVKI